MSSKSAMEKIQEFLEEQKDWLISKKSVSPRSLQFTVNEILDSPAQRKVYIELLREYRRDSVIFAYTRNMLKHFTKLERYEAWAEIIQALADRLHETARVSSTYFHAPEALLGGYKRSREKLLSDHLAPMWKEKNALAPFKYEARINDVEYSALYCDRELFEDYMRDWYELWEGTLEAKGGNALGPMTEGAWTELIRATNKSASVISTLAYYLFLAGDYAGIRRAAHIAEDAVAGEKDPMERRDMIPVWNPHCLPGLLKWIEAKECEDRKQAQKLAKEAAQHLMKTFSRYAADGHPWDCFPFLSVWCRLEFDLLDRGATEFLNASPHLLRAYPPAWRHVPPEKQRAIDGRFEKMYADAGFPGKRPDTIPFCSGQ